jgi:hypothetical protein
MPCQEFAMPEGDPVPLTSGIAVIHPADLKAKKKRDPCWIRQGAAKHWIPGKAPLPGWG